MPNAASRPRWNPWIALSGAVVLIALAIGLLSSGATPVGAQYGPPEPPPIEDFNLAPGTPKAGKGFKATFSTPGNVSYRIYVIDRIDNRFILRRGSANGSETTPTIGRRLKPGRYFLYAGRKTNETNQDGLPVYYDVKQQNLRVRR